ncbi:uncharacterized protein [Ptychodera flava]|uniref:uncharacterized protein n=1 Tax=Ptychodera flava TaxID=63121 RepID=UPI00396A45B1
MYVGRTTYIVVSIIASTVAVVFLAAAVNMIRRCFCGSCDEQRSAGSTPRKMSRKSDAGMVKTRAYESQGQGDCRAFSDLSLYNNDWTVHDKTKSGMTAKLLRTEQTTLSEAPLFTRRTRPTIEMTIPCGWQDNESFTLSAHEMSEGSFTSVELADLVDQQHPFTTTESQVFPYPSQRRGLLHVADVHSVDIPPELVAYRKY